MFSNLPVERQSVIVEKLIDEVTKNTWYKINLLSSFFSGHLYDLSKFGILESVPITPYIYFNHVMIDRKKEWLMSNVGVNNCKLEYINDTNLMFDLSKNKEVGPRENNTLFSLGEGHLTRNINESFSRDLWMEILLEYLKTLNVTLPKLREILSKIEIVSSYWMTLQFNGVKSLSQTINIHLSRKIKNGQCITLNSLPTPQIMANLWPAIQAKLTSKDSPKERAKFYLELGLDLLSAYWQSPGLKENEYPYGQLFQQHVKVSVRNLKSTNTFEGMWEYAEKMLDRKTSTSIDSFFMKMYKVPRGTARESFVKQNNRIAPTKATTSKPKITPTVSLAKAICSKK